jgi:hypothetical protein
MTRALARHAATPTPRAPSRREPPVMISRQAHDGAPDSGRWLEFTGNAAGVPQGAAVLLPLEDWSAFPGLWAARAGRIGLVLGPTDAIDRLLPVLDGVDAIAARGLDATARERLRAALADRGWRGTWLADAHPGCSPAAAPRRADAGAIA